jgi:hypothetical protein
MEFALFGIESGGLNLFVNLLVLFLVVVWLALVYWTYTDARRRMEDQVLIACSVAASLFPYIGTVVYAILRPPEFLEDERERELDTKAAELRLRQLRERSCPHCEYPIERNFIRCPSCQRQIKEPCAACGEPLDPRWPVCPYCETQREPARPVRRGAPQARAQKAPQKAPQKPKGSGRAPAQRSGAKPRAARATPTPQPKPR